MNTAILMLGSNVHPETNLELALLKLSNYFDIVTQSNMLITEPIGKKYNAEFHNLAIKVLSAEPALDTKLILKEIEKALGRNALSKHLGEITIDIDLIFWNDSLVNEDYKKFDFVKYCVDEIR